MRASDVNGDGEINFEEFLAAVVSKVKVYSALGFLRALLSAKEQQGRHPHHVREIRQEQRWSGVFFVLLFCFIFLPFLQFSFAFSCTPKSSS